MASYGPPLCAFEKVEKLLIGCCSQWFPGRAEIPLGFRRDKERLCEKRDSQGSTDDMEYLPAVSSAFRVCAIAAWKNIVVSSTA